MGERKTYFEYVVCSANQTTFTMKNQHTKQDMEWECPFFRAEIKNVNLWFPSGAGGWVFVRILKNGTPVAPDTGEGFKTRGFTSDDDHLPIFLNMVLEKTDKIAFEYINNMGIQQNFSIKMEVEGHDAKPGMRRKLPDVPGMKGQKKKAKPMPEGEPMDFRGGF